MITILAIESSCDDTSAAVIRDGVLLSNVIAGQKVHEEFGGVVPELASRAHQQNILPVVDTALKRAGVEKADLSAIAFTRGPGLLGSLLVGTSFAKGLALSLGIPLIEVNHLQGHVLAHFVRTPEATNPVPEFPFLCLLVSGGNSQIVLVKAYNDMQIIGQTIDDAAGEAFDKCAKVLGLPYPGGPWIDRLAKDGNPEALASSGSNRRYYRISGPDGKTLVGVAGLDVNENNAFVSPARHFRSKGINVPEVLAVSADGMCYLQEDLGDVTLYDAISSGRESGEYAAAETELLKKTVRMLPEIQFRGAEGLDFNVCFPEPAFDERMVMFDLNYFKYCFLKATGIEFNEIRLQDDFDRLKEDLLGEDTVTFLYRDFHKQLQIVLFYLFQTAHILY